MSRAGWVWGGVISLVLGLAAGIIALSLVAAATPEAHLSAYLDALAQDDLETAAELAGLEPDAAMPLGDTGDATIKRVLSRLDGPGEKISLVAEYGTDDDAVTAVFSLEPAEPRAGFIPEWRFATTPVTAAQVSVDHHDEFTVNGQAVTASEPGQPVTVQVFVPSRITATLAEPFLEPETASLRVTGSNSAVVEITSRPSVRLERAVQREVRRVLDECATQEVLQPTGCPFGRTIDDRILDRPAWERTGDVSVTIEPSLNAGRWEVTGTAEMTLRVLVQELFDGVVSQVDETVAASVLGVVVLSDDGPVLTIYPPGQ